MAVSCVRGGLYGASSVPSHQRRTGGQGILLASSCTAAAAARLMLSTEQERRHGWHTGSGPRSVATRAGGRGAVIDRPSTADPGTTTTIERSKDRQLKRPPIYKVMLHNDEYNRREYVVKVLLKVIQGISVDDAVIAMQEAHETGVSLVIACPQEDAEQYCEGLRLNGLTSTIEPTR